MAYTPTIYVNDNPPALNADNLNKAEQELVYLDSLTEKTKNINTSEVGRWYVNSSGVIGSSGNNWFGMKDMVACSGSTQYVASFYGTDKISADVYIAEYDSEGAFIQRTVEYVVLEEGYTITTDSRTRYICACCYEGHGITISSDAGIQIEKGSTSTGYVPPTSSIDNVARAITENVEIGKSRNIIDGLAIVYNNCTATVDGNGYKISSSSSSNSPRMRFTISTSVTNADVGKTYTFSGKLTEKTSSVSRINFTSQNTARKTVEATSIGDYQVTYTVQEADVGRALYAVIMPWVTASVDSGKYAIWHDIQLEEGSYKTEYVSGSDKTAVDETARAYIDVLFAKSNETKVGLNVSETLTANKTYNLPVEKLYPTIISCKAKYSGSTQPTIQYSTTLYSSPVFDLGHQDEYIMQQFVIPPAMNSEECAISIIVPSGVTLTIDNLSTNVVPKIDPNYVSRPRFVSHLGFMQMAPQNTRPAVELAGILGYPQCIVVPKVTSDNVLVCIHDDTINATARDSSGNPPSTDMYVSQMTYNQLLQWDFGRSFNSYYTGTKILAMDDFFAICARYGMKPTFSTHPGLTVSQWGDVKDLLNKHGLLKEFHVKAFDASILNTAFGVFGEDIDGYTGEHGDSYVTLPLLKAFVDDNNIDTKNVRIVSEKSINTIDSTYIAEVLALGFECGCYTINNTHPASRIKELVDLGVTSFTDNSYCVNGFEWA